MEHPAAVQPTPSTVKSHRKLVEALMYTLLGLLALAFVILQVNANRKYAAELTEKLEGEAFVFNQRDLSDNSILYLRHNEVSLLENGKAIVDYNYDVEDIYPKQENSTRNNFQETHFHNSGNTTWNVRISIFNRITVKVGETVFVVHKDESGQIDSLIEDGYKIYYLSPLKH